jgi:CRISPR-associated protein Cas2
MWILVTYDVNTGTAVGRKRLHKVAQTCKNFGQRVQKSVFECTVNQAQYEQMRRKLLKTINLKEDSLRFYKMASARDKTVEEYGVGEVIDFEGPLVV